MHSLYRAIFVAAITFGASVVGMLLQWVVPADVLTASKGSVGAMVGLVTLLLALVLGLLVFTAFSVYTTQQTEAQALGPVIIELDVVLEQYGADVAGARTGLRRRPGTGAQALLRRCEARASGAYVRGDSGDHALDEHLFRQPSASDRTPPAIARLGRVISPRSSLKRIC